MIAENRYSFFFIILLLIYLVETSNADATTNPDICTPSACGNIRNISFPFRLKLDPKHCGNPLFELECENNLTTILKLNSHKYRVKEISYANSTIWLADTSVNNNTCSLPNKTIVTVTAIRGTIGYVAPELINRGFGGVSYKADVYSFGILLMEMVGLNRNNNKENQVSSQYFPCWIYDCFERGQDIDVGINDENQDGDSNDSNKIITKKMTIVALWCIQLSPDNRPSMNKVVEMLEAPLERLRVPDRSSQSTPVVVNYEDQSWTSYSTGSTSLLGRGPTPSIEIV